MTKREQVQRFWISTLAAALVGLIAVLASVPVWAKAKDLDKKVDKPLFDQFKAQHDRDVEAHTKSIEDLSRKVDALSHHFQLDSALMQTLDQIKNSVSTLNAEVQNLKADESKERK